MYRLECDKLPDDMLEQLVFETEQEAEDEKMFIKMCGLVSDDSQIKIVEE